MINEDFIKRLRAWITTIGSGTSIGFIIGAIVALYIEPAVAKYYFWGFLTVGFFIGLLVAIILSKRGILKEGFEPLNRSADLDDFLDKYRDLDQDNEVLKLIPVLPNREFISLICFRYPQMLIETKEIMKQELRKRGIDKHTFLNYFSAIEMFRSKSDTSCPKCGFQDYKPLTNPGELNCELCGYYDKLENPSKFINRLKKAFGYFDGVLISADTIEDELY